MRQHVFASGGLVQSVCRVGCAAPDVARLLSTTLSFKHLVLCTGAVLIALAGAPAPLSAGNQTTAQQQAAAKAAAEAAAKAAAKAAAEAAAKLAAQQAAARAAAQAAAKAAAEAAARAAQQAAAKAAQQAAAKAAQQAAARAAAEAAARAAAQQQAAAKAAAERQKQQQQQQQQQAAAKAEAERQKQQQQQQQQQAAAKAEAERQKQQQQQQQQQAAAKAEAERQKQQQQQQQQQAAARAEAERQKQLQAQQAQKPAPAAPAPPKVTTASTPAPSQPPKAAAVSQPPPPQRPAAASAPSQPQVQPAQPVQKAVVAAPPPSAPSPSQQAPQPDPTPVAAETQDKSDPDDNGPEQPDAIDASKQAGAPPPDIKTQQAEIDALLRHAEQAAAERREQRRKLEELRRQQVVQTDKQAPVAQLAESPATAVAAQSQQSAQIEEIRQQLIRAELGRTEERKQLEDLKRRQQQIAEAAARAQQQPAPGEPAPSPGAKPEAAAPPQNEAERLQTAIAEFQRKQERWDQRRQARAKRIEELIALQKTRTEKAEQVAAAEQGKAAAAPPAQRLETLQQQARRMGLGHPDEKPAAPAQLETVKPNTPQPTAPAVGATPPAAGDTASGPVEGGKEQDASSTPQSPAGGDGAKPDGATQEASTPPGSASGASGTPAAAPDKGNTWHPEVIAGDEDQGPPWKRRRHLDGWSPEIVTAALPDAGPPKAGTEAQPAPANGGPAPQQGAGDKGAADEPVKAAEPTENAAPPSAQPATENPKTAPPKRDPRKPARGPLPGMGNLQPPQAEILATNMGPAELKKARELGFEPVAPTHLRNLGMKLTRLRVPRGANVAAMRRKLAQQMPMGGFADNQTYWIFGAARGRENRGMFSPPPQRKSASSDTGGSGYTSSATNSDSGTTSASDTGVGAGVDSTLNSVTAPITDPVNDATGDASGSAESEVAATTEDTAGENGAATDAAAAATGSKENEVAARSDESNATSRVSNVKPADLCKGDRCFASSLIKWHNDLRTCTKDVRIGIIDTSFDISHPAFKRMRGSSGEFLNGEAPSTHDWHGTAVLSLLAGDPASNTPGLIPDASFYLATAFKTDEAGNASTDTMRLLQALDWLDALDVRYINMSFSGPRDPLFEQAINRMVEKGTVFVAAAGNQGPTAPPSYPAAYPQVIAVTAVNKNAENYRHANRGTYVDLSAPGVEIMTALPDGRQGFRTGTSFAAPFVTAIVATRTDPAHGFKRKADLLSSLNLQDLGPPGPDPIYGKGLALAPKVCSGGSTVAHQGGPPPATKVSPGATAASAAW